MSSNSVQNPPGAPGPPGSPGSYVALPLLADPAGYTACRIDLRENAVARKYWINLFRSHFPSLLEEAIREAVDRGESNAAVIQRADEARKRFEKYLSEVETEPGRYGRLDIIGICRAREAELRKAKIDDAYRLSKLAENEKTLKLLPALLAELDALPIDERRLRIIEGIFAGNIYDLGATQTAALFDNGATVNFRDVRNKLAARPWLIDDLDAWMTRWKNGPKHHSALLFVDNAGSDIILGMIPFARELLRQGTSVILAANDTPSLNDITIEELATIITRIIGWDSIIRKSLASGKLELVASGNGLPLIDLTKCSAQLCEMAVEKDVDLIVLEGMGRGIESNLHAPFKCDVIKIAMIKDKGVADMLGGKVYDLVMRYEPKAAKPA
jgi:uncharacterized protein with ATP-grasp and redox domains